MCYSDYIDKGYLCGAAAGCVTINGQVVQTPAVSTRLNIICGSMQSINWMYRQYTQSAHAAGNLVLEFDHWVVQSPYTRCTPAQRRIYVGVTKLGRHCTLNLRGDNNCPQVDVAHRYRGAPGSPIPIPLNSIDVGPFSSPRKLSYKCRFSIRETADGTAV